MAISKDTERHIRPIAEESLSTFSRVAEAAKERLVGASSLSGADAFASINTLTSAEAVRKHEQITDANIEGYRALIREPVTARVVVNDEAGRTMTYHVCRTAPVLRGGEGIEFASYRSPVGRLASLPVGTEHTVTREGEPVSVEVVEYARFHPTQTGQEWDARNSVFEGGAYGPLTVVSLRALLASLAAETDATALDALLSEERAADIVREGIRRGVIDKMALRDQPILDEYQDDIFRLPLNSRLLILGAPGTGKTTTLIRRLGQKLDTGFLDEGEQRAIRNGMFGAEVDHARSWMLFAPTELLKLYVKEAFNREGIPAPDERISTWADCREDLARNEFGILRSAVSRSSLVMKDGAATLAAGTEADQTAWFADFDRWQKAAFWEEMRASALSLGETGAEEAANLGRRILAALDAAGATPQAGAFVSLMAVARDVRNLVERMKKATDGKIRGGLNLQVNRDRQFLDDMATFIESLAEVGDDPDDQDAEDEEEANLPRVGRAGAVGRYMRAVRAQARARARKRSIPKSSPTGRMVEWLNDRSLAEEDLQDVGESLVIQSALRVFVNPAKRYIDRMPARYRRFRRVRQSEKHWYRTDGFSATAIHPLEVDIVLLAMMRASDALVTGARGALGTDNQARGALERMERLYRTQVLVDEATDFSPIQLACMAVLARPGTRSFFACGDFNQRITSWGTRSVEDMRWVVPDVEIKPVSVGYRQSRHLHDFARKIVEKAGAGATDVVLPEFAENDGVPPVLACGMTDVPEIASWLADRICEIERSLQELPSIAVLVNDESAVGTVADALGEAVTNQNIRVIPCHNGQVRGRDNAVRVFNVQHIKGLEFEAVFFVGIDRLARSYPELFGNYLYVGATRAATYLGLTCEQELPDRMKELGDGFGERWE